MSMKWSKLNRVGTLVTTAASFTYLEIAETYGQLTGKFGTLIAVEEAVLSATRGEGRKL